MKTTFRLIFCIAVWMVVPAMIQSSNVNAQDYVKSDFMVSDLSDYYYKSPRLSVNNSGDMAIVWATSGSGNIWLRTISNMGTQPGEEKLVPSAYNTMEPSVAYGDSGNLMVMYQGNYDSWSVYGQVYDSEGNEIGDTLELKRNPSENINHASLFADQNSSFIAFLSGRDSAMLERISENGEFMGSTIALKPVQPYASPMKAAKTRSGQFIMIWQGGFGGGIIGQRYTSEGIAIGETIQVYEVEEDSYVQNYQLACDTSGNFAVTWTIATGFGGDVGQIYSQLYSAEGVSVGSRVKISDQHYIESIGGFELSIDMDVDGKFVIAWPDTRGTDTSFIYMQQLDKLGVPVGGNFRATTINNDIQPGTGLPSQLAPSVKILRDTIYLVWTNHNQDVSNRQNIFANIQLWMVPDGTGNIQLETNSTEPAIFPNPSSGIFTLKINENYTGPIDWELYTGTGVLIRKKTGFWSGNETSIDLSAFPEGMYYLKVSGDSFLSTKPLIIFR